MAQWKYLLRLDLELGSNTAVFLAEVGDTIEITFEPLDVKFDTASRKLLKLKRGWRANVRISFILRTQDSVSLAKADFLRMVANSQTGAYIGYAEPFDDSLAGKTLIIERVTHPEVFSDYVSLFEAIGWIKEPLDNIPSLE